MAFTDPRTWVTDELVTAAMMNAHVRDNFNAVPHLLAYKTADESVTSSTTVQDDNHLLVALGANELWHLRVVMFMTGDSPTPGMKVAFTVPTSATIVLTVQAHNSTGTGAGGNQQHWTFSGDERDLLAISAGSCYVAEGIVETVATAGNFQLQFAQYDSSGTPVVMKKGSAIYGLQLA